MKNIIVIGPPRVGKTTLSKVIVNQIPCYSIINLDVIRESIYKSMCANMEKKESKKVVKESFPSFIRAMLKQYTKYYNPDFYYILEGDILSIEDALEIKKDFDVDIVCVGTPSIDENDLFNRTRKNASINGCWTKSYSDDQLHNLCNEIINRSKKEMNISSDNELTYLDNSYNSECFQDYANSIKKGSMCRSLTH